MNKLIFVCLILVSCVAVSFAQPNRQNSRRSPEERAEMTVKILTKELNLSAEQATKIKVIQLENIKKIDKIREKGQESGDRKALREEVKAINEAGEKEIKDLLSADQAKKFDEWKAKREEEMRNRIRDRKRN